MYPRTYLLCSKLFLIVVSILITLTLISCQQAASPTNDAATSTPAPVDMEQLANRIVTNVAGIKEGEIVFINGGVRDLELLEKPNTDVRKVAA
jgi:hypothetical protein